MRIAISTNWNAALHEEGAPMLDEIAALGFDAVELGYALSFGQAEEVKRRIGAGSLRVTSVHAFCPNPMPGSHLGPEPFSICDPRDLDGPRHGIDGVIATARFASEMRAPKVVLHAGRVPVFRAASRLASMVESGKRDTPSYARRLARFQDKRFAKSAKYMDALEESLEIILPQLRPLGVTLCLENLPSGDAMPNESEMAALLRRFEGEPLAYWRTEEGLEVDFLVGERTAIQAKARRAVGKDDLRGLRELRKEGAFKRFVVASLEPRPRVVDGIEILPWRDFVERLWSGDFD